MTTMTCKAAMTCKEATMTQSKGSKNTSWTQRIDFREHFKSLFDPLSIFICQHSWMVCIVSFFFNGLLGLGMLNLRTSHLLNNDIDDLYIPKDNPTQKTAEDLLKLFPDTSGYDFYSHQSIKQPLFGEVQLWRHDRGNILQESCYAELTYVMEYIKNISFLTTNGEYIAYHDLCARRNRECVIQGQEIVELVRKSTNGEIKMDQLYHKDGRHYESSLDSVAEYILDSGNLRSARYLKVRFNLRHDSEVMLKNSRDWQISFVKSMKELLEYQTLSTFNDQPLKSLGFVFHHANSFYEELGNDTYPDIGYVSFVFTIFLTYIGFVTSGGDCLSKRTNVARMGFITLPVSILGAWGLLMACGVEFTNAIGLTPIYLGGQQLISTMVTLSHLSDTYGLETAQERVVYTMRNSALSTTMTSLIHVASFGVGIASKFYVLKLVCIYFVVTVTFSYFNHLIFFMSIVAIHEQRIDKGIHFCCLTKLRPREELKEARRNCCAVCCCSGQKPEAREDTESRVEFVSRKLMTRYVLTLPAKIVCTLGFLSYTFFYIWGLVHYTVDSLQVSDVAAESYFSDWQHRWEGRFENKSTIQFVVVHPNGYLVDREIMHDFKNALISKEYLQQHSLQSWHDAFENSTLGNVASEAELVQSIQADFLLQYPIFHNDLVLDIVRKQVVVSRLYIQTRDILSTKSMVDMKEELQNMVKTFNDKAVHIRDDEYDGDGQGDDNDDGVNDADDNDNNYPQKFSLHSPSFLHTDWSILPLWEILKISSAQFGLLLILLMLLYPNFVLPFIVLLSYLTIVGGLYGMSQLFGTFLNPVSMISYMISSCYSVEVIGHTLVSLVSVAGTGRWARINAVLSTTSQALLHPLFGQMLGIIVLVGCTSYVFRCVFIIFLIATAICVGHVVFFVPTLLSLLGPGYNLPDGSVDFFQPGNISKDSWNNGVTHYGDQHDVIDGLKAKDIQLIGDTNYGYQHDYI